MRDLNFSLKRLCDQKRHGSHGSQAERRKNLNVSANDLHELGYKGIKGAENLKPKHIQALVHHWKGKGLSVSTIKNRMVYLRWVATQTNNPSLLKKDNAYYNIENRVYATNEDKALRFTDAEIAKISSPEIRLSAELQREFGLRREESMKFRVSVACDNPSTDNSISLQGSWCKNGRPREVPIRTDAQRDLLSRVSAHTGNGSLIPAHKSYVTHLKLYESQMSEAGIGRSHGARHAYAQDLYKSVTGWDCPAAGGVSKSNLRPDQVKADERARLMVSTELGHNRINISNRYLGR